MKNILITGGLGFIGSNFIKHIFNKYNYNIFNVDLKTYAASYDNISDEINNSGRYSLSICDINDTDRIRNLIQKNDINYIVNFAAESHVDNSINDSTPFVQTNINGTHSLLSLLRDCSTIERYLQVSTDEVYGALSEEDDAFTENTSIQANSPYSASKASADLLCRSFYETFDYPILITRCSNNYGPNQHEEKLIPLMIKKVKAGEKLPVYGDGRNIRDWIHVADHCSGIDAVLHGGKIGEVYNIGGKNEVRNINIVKTILKLLDKDEDQIEYVKDRLGHDWRYAIDNSKIQEELNWFPSVKFKDGLKDLITKQTIDQNPDILKMSNKLRLAECEEQYWEFVRSLRLDERVLDGFIEKMEITPEQQTAYMTQHSECFRIALLDNEPVGYFGVIEDDIRVCVHPDHQKKGIGKFLVNSCFEIWPTALAKIKVTNESSQKLFESCGYKKEYYLYSRN